MYDMKRRLLYLLVAGLFLFIVTPLHAQRWGVKTNVLYDATSTINLGVEVGLAPKWTLDVSGNYNPWTFSDYKKLKHWMLPAGGPLLAVRAVQRPLLRASRARR